MKTTKITLLALGISLLAGCRKGDDLYINPNVPKAASPQTMLTAIEANTFMNYEGGIARIASIMVQHNSGITAQYLATDAYDLTESDMDNYWGGLYYGAMKNAKLMYTQFEGANPYYGGIAKVLLAFNLGIATDMWGDVPYSEAFQLENNVPFPHPDPQAALLNNIQTLLDQAIADFGQSAVSNANLPSNGTDDLIFGGNISAWVKTAWTLKARYHNRLSKKDATGSATNVLADLANGMTSNADNCKSVHNTGSDPNQWAAFQSGRKQNVLACKVLIDSLGNMADPRTPFYFDTTGQGNVAYGSALGGADVNASPWGPYLNNAAGSTPLVTYAEAAFLKAEANYRLGNAVAALAELQNGIKASISDVTNGASTGTAQAALYTAANTNTHTIMLEKWKAMFAQPIEAYSDFRRTGYPVLKPRPGGVLNFIPRRMPTALGERTNNPNASTLDVSVPVWYAQ